MGEKVTVTDIQIIDQTDSCSRVLLQIDMYFENQEKHERVFIDSMEFFKLLSKNGK